MCWVSTIIYVLNKMNTVNFLMLAINKSYLCSFNCVFIWADLPQNVFFFHTKKKKADVMPTRVLIKLDSEISAIQCFWETCHLACQVSF